MRASVQRGFSGLGDRQLRHSPDGVHKAQNPAKLAKQSLLLSAICFSINFVIGLLLFGSKSTNYYVNSAFRVKVLLNHRSRGLPPIAVFLGGQAPQRLEKFAGASACRIYLAPAMDRGNRGIALDRFCLKEVPDCLAKLRAGRRELRYTSNDPRLQTPEILKENK